MALCSLATSRILLAVVGIMEISPFVSGRITEGTAKAVPSMFSKASNSGTHPSAAIAISISASFSGYVYRVPIDVLSWNSSINVLSASRAFAPRSPGFAASSFRFLMVSVGMRTVFSSKYNGAFGSWMSTDTSNTKVFGDFWFAKLVTPFRKETNSGFPHYMVYAMREAAVIVFVTPHSCRSEHLSESWKP